MESDGQDTLARVRDATAALRRASRRLILLWIAVGAILTAPEYILFRYGLFLRNRALIEVIGLAAYNATLVAITFLVGVIFFAKALKTTAKSQLIWHTAIWTAALAVAVPVLGRYAANAGWSGTTWFYLVIGAAAIGGIPFGCVRSAAWLGKYQLLLETRSRLSYTLKKLNNDRAESAVLSGWHRECDLTSAAIDRFRGRNHVSDQYANKAREAMAALLTPSGPCGTLAERTVGMAEFRRKVEAGETIS